MKMFKPLKRYCTMCEDAFTDMSGCKTDSRICGFPVGDKTTHTLFHLVAIILRT